MTGHVLGAAVLPAHVASLPAAGRTVNAAPRAWGNAQADGDGRVTASGSGELLEPRRGEPRPGPPPSDSDPLDVRVPGCACRAAALTPRAHPCEHPCDGRPDQAPAAPDSNAPPTTVGGLGTGAPVTGVALRARGIRLLEVESASGLRYAGWVVTGDLAVSPWRAEELDRLLTFFMFWDEP